MDRQEAIQKHLSDMLALERHILEAITRQRDEEEVRRRVEANELIIRIERMLRQHTASLETLAEAYDARSESALKKAVTGVVGVVAGLYDKVRDHEVSRILRDDYTALSLSAMAYTALHTFGLTIREDRIADTAVQHLRDVTPLLVELSKVLPVVVADEVGQALEMPVDRQVGHEAVRRTQEAWAPGVTDVLS